MRLSSFFNIALGATLVSAQSPEVPNDVIQWKFAPYWVSQIIFNAGREVIGEPATGHQAVINFPSTATVEGEQVDIAGKGFVHHYRLCDYFDEPESCIINNYYDSPRIVYNPNGDSFLFVNVSYTNDETNKTIEHKGEVQFAKLNFTGAESSELDGYTRFTNVSLHLLPGLDGAFNFELGPNTREGDFIGTIDFSFPKVEPPVSSTSSAGETTTTTPSPTPSPTTPGVPGNDVIQWRFAPYWVSQIIFNAGREVIGEPATGYQAVVNFPSTATVEGEQVDIAGKGFVHHYRLCDYFDEPESCIINNYYDSPRIVYNPNGDSFLFVNVSYTNDETNKTIEHKGEVQFAKLNFTGAESSELDGYTRFTNVSLHLLPGLDGAFNFELGPNTREGDFIGTIDFSFPKVEPPVSSTSTAPPSTSESSEDSQTSVTPTTSESSEDSQTSVTPTTSESSDPSVPTVLPSSDEPTVRPTDVVTTSGQEPSVVTEVVTAYTTYCPEPTVITEGSQTITVTAPTTVTITDCPCTITRTLKPTEVVSTYTEVVTKYTTYCPEPTVITHGSQTITVTKPTTITITDCPCTITHTSTSTKDHKPTKGTHSSSGEGPGPKPSHTDKPGPAPVPSPISSKSHVVPITGAAPKGVFSSLLGAIAGFFLLL